MTQIRRRTLSRTYEPIDELFESQDLYRKQLPRDGSSLFRAVAEQACLSQSYHEEVRKLCLEYMMMHKNYFQSFISEPLEHHIMKMTSVLERGGDLEMVALSLLFKVDLQIYDGECMAPTSLTNYGFNTKLKLYRDSANHFDIIYTKHRTVISGYCQALVYQMLYSNVFKVDSVMNIVDQMLHDSSSRYRTDSSNSNDFQDIFRIVQQVTNPNGTPDDTLSVSLDNACSPVREITPPFPYRVAKALDPDIYRNSDFDIYTAMKKEARYGPYDSKGLQRGVKVIIKTWLISKDVLKKYEVDEKEVSSDTKSKGILCGHIQTMTENHGPVEVYVEDLAKRIFVPYDSLEKFSQTPVRASFREGSGFIASTPPYKMLSSSYPRRPLSYPEHLNSPGGCKNKRKFSLLPLPAAPKAKDKKIQKECDGDNKLLVSRQQGRKTLEKQPTNEENSPECRASPLPPPLPLLPPPPLPASNAYEEATSGAGYMNSPVSMPQPVFDHQGWYIVNPVGYPVDPVLGSFKQTESALVMDNSANMPVPLFIPAWQQMGCNGQYVPHFSYPQGAEPYSPVANVSPVLYGTPPAPSMMIEYYEPSQCVYQTEDMIIMGPNPY